MAASNDRVLDRRSVHLRSIRGIPMAASAKGYQDAFAGFTSGTLRALTAGDVFAGVFARLADNSSGAASAINGTVENGVSIKHAVVGADGVDHVGALVYASDDETLTLTKGSNSFVGVVEEYLTGTTCWVRLATPVEVALFANRDLS
jgi:hypothetical protein